MRYLDLNVLTSQIESVFTKYNKKIPEIKLHKFTEHIVLIVDAWEFYFDKVGEGFIFNNIIDSSHNEDTDLTKIKGYIMCELINNKIFI